MKSDSKKIKKRIIKLAVASTLVSIVTINGIKLVKGSNEATKILEMHNNSNSTHSENIVAHRGFSALEPDNSYESVLLALDTDCVDMIEIDVRKTLDNQIILHHDTTINFDNSLLNIEDINLDEVDTNTLKRRYPFFKIEGYLYDDSLFQLQRFLKKDAEDKEIIKFDDFIEWYSFDKPLIVDIKAEEVSLSFMARLNDILKDKKDKIYLQSNYYEFISKMMDLYPDYKYFFIVNSMDDLANMDDDFTGFTVKKDMLSKIEIDKDKMYLIYTVNSSKSYLKLISNKKYKENMYIITDNPDYICALSDEKKKVYLCNKTT
jgi:glycerophosphoryl diester phosphodiesterase